MVTTVIPPREAEAGGGGGLDGFKSSLGHIARPCWTEGRERNREGRKEGDHEKDLCMLMKKEHQNTVVCVVVFVVFKSKMELT